MTQDHPLKAQSKMVFDDYAKELGVSPEELGHATTIGANEELLKSIKDGTYVYIPYNRRGHSSARANSRSLVRAGIFKNVHSGLIIENIDWERFDELLSIRNRISADALPPALQIATPIAYPEPNLISG